MFYLASQGYRCIAHDRRGHGRSSQPWNGNDMDTYADDLAKLVKGATLKVYPGCRTACARRTRTRSTLICSRSSRHKLEIAADCPV